MTVLLLVAIIVADNPANVFANILATILRLAIIATNHLSLMSFVWLVMHLIPLLSQLYLVCLLSLGLWILLVAII